MAGHGEERQVDKVRSEGSGKAAEGREGKGAEERKEKRKEEKATAN